MGCTCRCKEWVAVRKIFSQKKKILREKIWNGARMKHDQFQVTETPRNHLWYLITAKPVLGDHEIFQYIDFSTSVLHTERIYICNYSWDETDNHWRVGNFMFLNVQTKASKQQTQMWPLGKKQITPDQAVLWCRHLFLTRSKGQSIFSVCSNLSVGKVPSYFSVVHFLNQCPVWT